VTIQAWVTIGVFVAGILWSVGVWLAGRRVSRMDKLEETVNGKNGLVHMFDRLVTRDEFTEKHLEIEEILKGISEEGQVREQRIRDHVDQGRRNTEQDLRDLRQEINGLNRRIDAALRGRR
jgi:hypothetical protein